MRASSNRFEYWKPGNAGAKVVNNEFLKQQQELALENKHYSKNSSTPRPQTSRT
jgi:hypothetical protein